MNKQSISKLTLLLMGLENRFDENKDIFNEIVVTFFAGLKSFKGIGKYDDNNINFNFNGKTNKLSIKDLNILICKEAEKFDSLQILYKERGTGILIEGSNEKVNMKNINIKETIDDEIKTPHNKTSTLLNRDYYIKVGEADSLLKEIGIMSKEGKIKNDRIRKYNQIDHYVELLEGILHKLPDNETINILDCGCGKSYLTFILNYYLTEVKKRKCHFIGLDISDEVIKSSKNMANNLGYRNMEFKAIDIKNYSPDKKIHVVISLHACDTATDMALALGIRLNSDVIIAVPCCHRELLSQYSYEPFKGILKHGLLKARMADVITDGMRSMMLEGNGYDVSIVEYISPLETPKNLMIRALKTKNENKNIKDAYVTLMNELNANPALYNFLNNW
ncbi:SAM-dependent methyltransferase [Clostridium sp. MSJ-11]|uniref:SAM-dependent methyltransferase n=1 Tax=Clostridium mobile TaxID=2841512 RepID=A0ABS6EMP6_9CLOT|nr:SAM-dependent methyltransferase [Clostridium mobile]MBU5486499.1 SAM-dependent methyltransferase [Clostridium mobile]